MSDATATTRPDCPDVPGDTQWNEMIQRELLCDKDAKDVSDELAKKVLRAINVNRAYSLQLAPCMLRKSILTEHEHAQLISRHITELDRTNKLSEIMLQRCTVGWLLRFCQCLLESYASERSLGSHYKLFQEIKGRVHSLLLDGPRQQQPDTTEAVANRIKSVPVSSDAKERLIRKLQLVGRRHMLDNLNQVTTSDVANAWLAANKSGDWAILVEALLTEPGLGHAVSGVLPLSLSNPPAVWNYVRSLWENWSCWASYLGYSDSLISCIRNKQSWDIKSQIQDFMRVCLIPDCGEQCTEKIVAHFKGSLKFESQSQPEAKVPTEQKGAAEKFGGPASKPRADEWFNLDQGASYQPQIPAKQTNPRKFGGDHLKETGGIQKGASYPPQIPVKQTNPVKLGDQHLKETGGIQKVAKFPHDPTLQQVLNSASAASIERALPRSLSDSAGTIKKPDGRSKLGSTTSRSLDDPKEMEKDLVRLQYQDDGQALLRACISEEWEVVEALISSGSTLEAQDKDGRTPLHICCIKGKVQIVRSLIEHGANATAKDNLDNCCLHHKETLKKPEVASEVIPAFAKKNVSVDQPNKNGVTPLMVACLSGDICCQAALTLITHDARVDGLPNIDDKPLICASAGGNIMQVKHLLTYGADVDQKHGRDGSTALIQACLCNHPQIVRVLLEYKPNVNLAGKDGSTALAAAVTKNGYEMVQMLIEKGGANVDCTRIMTSGSLGGSVEQTPLATACARGYRDIAELLICSGANINSGRVPPVGFAIMFRQEHMLKFLLEVEGYDKSIYGLRIPIDIALRAGNYAAAKILLDARGGPDVALRDAQHNHLSELANQIQLVQNMPKEELLSSGSKRLALGMHGSSEMRDQTAKVEEVLQRFCQICMSAITNNMDCETLLGIMKALGAPQHIAFFIRDYYRRIQRPDILMSNFLNGEAGMSPATFFTTNLFVDVAKFHVHAMEFYPEGPDDFYSELVFTVHQITGGEGLPYDVNGVLERMFSGQFSLNVRTATIGGQLLRGTPGEHNAWPQLQTQSMLPYNGEPDECVSTAPRRSRPLFNGTEMRQPSENTAPLPARALNGERNKTGMLSARESDVGRPLKNQQSVPVQPQVVPNAPVSTESPVPSMPPAYKPQRTSPSEHTASPEASVSTAGIDKELPISVEKDAVRYKDQHHAKRIRQNPESLLLRDTNKEKHNLSDPETPEDERKDVLGELIKPSVEDTEQVHSKASSRITPPGKTAASARLKQTATKVPQPTARYGTREKAAGQASSTKSRGTRTHLQRPKVRPSTAADKKPRFDSSISREMELKNVKILGKIGEGAFGYVERIEMNGKIYAGKRFRADRSFNEKKFHREFKILQGLSHRHIVKYCGYHIVPGGGSMAKESPMLVMECMVSNVHDILISPSHRNLPLSRKVFWLHGVAQGLEYLHSQSVMHRDLTAPNVLLNEKAFPKISDFGNSCVTGDDLGSDYYSQSLTAFPGTLAYMAPEAQTKNYGNEIDIFSFGHLSLFIGTQRASLRLLGPTFTDPHTRLLQPRNEVQRREDHFSYLYRKLQQSHPLVTLIKECFANSPESRPKANELVSRLQTMCLELSHPPPLSLK